MSSQLDGLADGIERVLDGACFNLLSVSKLLPLPDPSGKELKERQSFSVGDGLQ